MGKKRFRRSESKFISDLFLFLTSSLVDLLLLLAQSSSRRSSSSFLISLWIYSISKSQIRQILMLEISKQVLSGRKTGWLLVSSAHSNPKIINPKKKSRYGQTLSPYDTDEEEELDDDDDDDDDWLLNDDFAEVTEYQKKKPKSQKQTIAKKGGRKEIVKSLDKLEESETDDDELDIGITRNGYEKRKKEKDSWRLMIQLKPLNQATTLSWPHTTPRGLESS